MKDRHREAYREEAVELLAELETSLLELERKPDDADLVGRVFRALHTIKGSGAMFGFDEIAGFTHEVETVFDGVREGRVAVTAELVGATLAARDHILRLLDRSGAAGVEPPEIRKEVLRRLWEAAPAAASPSAAPAGEGAHSIREAGGEEPANYRIGFDPDPGILLTGANPILLFQELRDLGEFSLIAHVERIPELAEFDPETCSVYWDGMLTAKADENAVRDAFIFMEDRARISIARFEPGDEAAPHRIGDLLVERGDVEREALERTLAERQLTGRLLVEAGLVTGDRVEAAALEQRHLEAVREKRRKAEASSSATLRVPAAKLDGLVDVVGELVTVQARLSGFATVSGDPEIGFIAEEVERLVVLLREGAMSLRMLPIGETFSKYKRLVRDLCSELGKKVEIVTEGNETELDKTVIEQLGDPLVHLIRNAVDHGIESPERRAAAGKPLVGTLRLSASHAGAFVLIRVADDGAGIDREKVRARAVERGLVQAGATLTDEETDGLIFTPGFSTASKVSEVSGRGVGLDVVQRSLDALRGSLSVASAPGRGMEVTLKIPLTLAIIDGLLVEVGDARFVAPLSNILECIELSGWKGGEAQRASSIAVRDELVPCVTLRRRFSIQGEAPPIEQAIVADTHEGKCGFVVDRVVGDHHAVIKKLGGMYRNVEEISGATILGDGGVALVLDVDRIAAAAIRESRQEPMARR